MSPPASPPVSPPASPPVSPPAAPEIPGYLHQASPELRTQLAATGHKTFEDFGKSYLELYQDAGKRGVVLPGEKATPEEITAFHHAIGVPKDAKDYGSFDYDGVKADENMVAFATSVFPQAGVTPRGKEILVKGWNKLMADTVKAAETKQAEALATGETNWAKAQGANHAAHQDIAHRAAEFFGVKGDQLTAMKKAIGYEATMNLFLKAGNAVATDGVQPTGGAPSFTINTPDGAKAEIARMTADPAIAALLRGEGDPKQRGPVKEKWDRLHKIVADNQK